METVYWLVNAYELDSNYNHTVDFNNQENQLNYFRQKTLYVLDDTMYQRKDDVNNVIVAKTLNELRLVNYLVAINDDGTRYFYFVMNKEYSDEDCTTLTLKLDLIQTYLFNINFTSSLVEREHTTRWSVQQNGDKFPSLSYADTDEGLEVGEYRILDKVTVYDYKDKGSYIFTSSDMLGVSNDSRPNIGEGGESGGTGGGTGGGSGGTGEITGDWISKNDYLSMEEMQNNAKLVWKYFRAKGWSLNAVCGMLGNMQTESYINPGIWESMDENNLENGYGLVQWTPASKYINWAGTNYKDGDKQCERIIYEMENGLQWLSTSTYPMSFSEFSTSTESPSYLAMVFIANYERPYDPNQPIRGTQAEYWYNYLKEV